MGLCPWVQCLQGANQGRTPWSWGSRGLWASWSWLWELLRSSGRTAGALDCWALPLLHLHSRCLPTSLLMHTVLASKNALLRLYLCASVPVLCASCCCFCIRVSSSFSITVKILFIILMEVHPQSLYFVYWVLFYYFSSATPFWLMWLYCISWIRWKKFSSFPFNIADIVQILELRLIVCLSHWWTSLSLFWD